MSVGEVAVAVLLSLGVLVTLLCTLGVVLGRTAYEKLHFLGPLAPLSAVMFAAAVVVQNSSTQGSIKAVLVALVLLLANGVLTHATARALHLRDQNAGHHRKGKVES
ncbi:monovalent cation/H(+) antiporter subunit G [Deinococcus hohokamensis]|uniref:Monovalent cation/H(+) antiporter subunit G n=1 Tax=Deinococcus hohokamensis TaxID=309883 RepID=A0ABV9I9J6_9DEIO